MAIYEKEIDYAVGLANYLNRQREFPFQVCLFTNPESLEQYTGEHNVDILLLGEDCEDTDLNIQTLKLSGRGNTNKGMIYKYQSARTIMREVSDYCVTNGIENDEKPETEQSIFAVFSAGNGIGRNKYVKYLTQDLVRKGTVLYLNFDLFPETQETGEEEERGLSEFIYYLKQNGELMQLQTQFRSMLKREGWLCSLSPIHCSMDLQALTEGDISRLFSLLRMQREFMNVVLEVGYFNESILEFCRHCDQLLLVTEKDGNSSSEFFLNQIKIMQGEGLEKKFKKVDEAQWAFGKN